MSFKMIYIYLNVQGCVILKHKNNNNNNNKCILNVISQFELAHVTDLTLKVEYIMGLF